jgi:hypothetical protein
LPPGSSKDGNKALGIDQQSIVDSPAPLVEEEDYYWEGEAMVFTAHYHLRRGYCCEQGCRHCPYEDKESQTT